LQKIEGITRIWRREGLKVPAPRAPRALNFCRSNAATEFASSRVKPPGRAENGAICRPLLTAAKTSAAMASAFLASERESAESGI
jgi:hypothetical protein